MKHWKFYLKLRRYLGGSLGEAEKQRFERFLDETTLTDEPGVWDQADQNALFERINKKIHEPKPVKKRMSTPRFIGIATLVTFGLLLGYYVALKVVFKQEREFEKIFLSDGTIVWLKAGDKLSYYEAASGSERHATLSGEALFEVAKDPLRPFIVQCGSTSLKVMGTSFTVQMRNDSVTLAVLTGNVRMYSADDPEGISVLPNEHVLYRGSGMISKQTGKSEDVPDYVQTTEYNMQFVNATVEELVDRIEKKFDVNVVVADARAKRCHVTADFTDHSLDKTLTLLTEVLDLTYSVAGKEVTLNGNGCQ